MKPNFTDARGTITDLIVTGDYSVTHITFSEGAVRGNHYHEQTHQYDFLLKGELQCVSSTNGERKESIVKEKDFIDFPPNVAHAYKATKPSEMISICFGVRKGEDYEKDVIRLTEPLI